MRRVPEAAGPAAATADAVAAWRALTAAHAAVHAALETELRREHDLSTVEYEVLDRLGECAAGKVRMQELAEVVHLTQSTCSRVVARLEEEGLARRATCANDRRGIFASVTDAGRERLAAATPSYRRVITEKLG
jgi:DNA-binding MarR family transcriptional regulator